MNRTTNTVKVEKLDKLIAFVDFLGKSTLAYRKLITQKDVKDDEEEMELLRLCLQPTIASVTPLILAVFAREVNATNRTELFALIEKLNFRYYGCDIAPRADSGQGQLFEYAHSFYNFYGKQMEGETVDSDWLAKKLTDFVRKYASDKSFVEALTLDQDESGDYYRWKSLKFFLANYEDDLQQKVRKRADLRKMLAGKDDVNLNMSYEREHLWALGETKHIDDTDWDERHMNRRRLGNFVLLEPSINRSVKHAAIEEKIERYFDGLGTDIPNTKMVRELKEMYVDAVEHVNQNRTNKTWRYWEEVFSVFMDRREEKMVNFALERWCIKHSKGGINKVTIDSACGENQIFKKV